MIFLGYKDGVKGFLFMCAPNNVLFTGATALFDSRSVLMGNFVDLFQLEKFLLKTLKRFLFLWMMVMMVLIGLLPIPLFF